MIDRDNMDTPEKMIITASEIGTYAFCPRAWALEKRGYRSSNRKQLEEGTAFHQAFGRRERLIKDLKVIAFLVLLVVLTLLIRELVK